MDLARELGRRIADRWQVVNLDVSDALLDALATGKVHAVVAGVTYMVETVMDLALSDGYFESGPVVLVRAGSADIRGPGDLARKRVAVEIGSLGEGDAHRLQKRLLGTEIIPMLGVEPILEAVVEGSADAAVVDRASIPLGFPLLERVGLQEAPFGRSPT